MSPKVVILSTADFRSAVWTNKQYMAAGLSQYVDVTYIESMGLRQPNLSASDINRVVNRINPFGRLGRTEFSQTAGYENISIIPPRVIPFHRFRAIRAINQRLVQSDLARRTNANRDDTLWTFSPMTYGLEDHFGKVIYHSVDLLHTLPGVPAEALIDAECALVRRADIVIASSHGVADHLTAIGASEVRLWENVADVEMFANSRSAVRRPTAIFAGNLTTTKVDFAILERIADSGIQLVLAGPVDIDGVGSESRLESLLTRSNVDYLGKLSLQELAAECGRSSVGLIPYVQSEYTKGVFPLKVYEYLSAGLHVVSTAIASIDRSKPQGVTITSTDDDFVAAVESAIKMFNHDEASVRSVSAQKHSWATRIDQAYELILN
ncbi:glycosyltransferase [Rhodococcus wratislaviensis]|uniref:glycosyltransferase n=1 Tax=Rhodococcus wratislaviensis TaxID=44752 RepID=UPI00365F69EE